MLSYDWIQYTTHISAQSTRRKASSYQFALLKLTLKTGRTHKIRVHCVAMGYPGVGYHDRCFTDTGGFGGIDGEIGENVVGDCRDEKITKQLKN